MNYPRSLRAGVADVNGPGANFFDACREISLQTQQLVGGNNQTVQARLVLADLGKKHLLVFFIHVGHLGFHLGADCHHRCLLFGGVGL